MKKATSVAAERADVPVLRALLLRQEEQTEAGMYFAFCVDFSCLLIVMTLVLLQWSLEFLPLFIDTVQRLE